MRIHLQVWAAIALLCVLPLSGCANPQAVGERSQRAAQAADDGIQVIDGILADFPEGDELALLDAVRVRLPLQWQSEFDRVLENVGDARDALVVVRNDFLVTFRDEAQARAREAFAQADKQADDFDNIVWSLGEIAAWVGGPTAAAILAVIGLIRERRRTRESNDAFDDVVTSIDAARKASSGLEEAFQNGGGAAIKSSMSPATQRRVAAVRNATTKSQA